MNSAIEKYYQFSAPSKNGTLLELLGAQLVFSKKNAVGIRYSHTTIVFPSHGVVGKILKDHIMSKWNNRDGNTVNEKHYLCYPLHSIVRDSSLVYLSNQLWDDSLLENSLELGTFGSHLARGTVLVN